MFYKRLRAWHKENKIMYKVTGIDFEDELIYADQFLDENSDYTKRDLEIPFDEVVIMQESGLQDDIGFNVFQGDLIRFEGQVFVLMYGDYGDSRTKVTGFGWHIAGEMYTFAYVGGGEKIGNSFENPVVEK